MVEVGLHELRQMLDALLEEMEACHLVLLQQNLLDQVDTTKMRIKETRAKERAAAQKSR